jgi:hypothetical protein
MPLRTYTVKEVYAWIQSSKRSADFTAESWNGMEERMEDFKKE